MPPFLFNRISQPFCSLPLPPPLPQIGSLPLTPFVQQMVMQQYANPVAVLPFTQNWQMSQAMMPMYPSIPQQQPQPVMPISTFQTPPSMPQPSIPLTLPPANMPLFPPNAASFPFSSDALSSAVQTSTGGYPSTCRACIPAPPLLNVPVTGHCWVQHCSACHHVPADTSSPNTRPTDGRSTPLLRHSVVMQNAYNPIVPDHQQQQYPHINTSMTMRPWLHEMPPLPPGGVIVSDEYLTPNHPAQTYHFSQNYAPQQPRVFHSLPRSITISTINSRQKKMKKKKSSRKRHKKYADDASQSNSTFNSSASLSYANTSNTRRSSTSSSCSLCNESLTNEPEKSDITPQNSQSNLAHQNSSAAAHPIQVRYNYQPPDLASVYNKNLYLKSSDTDSTSLSEASASSNRLTTKQSDLNTTKQSDLNTTKQSDLNTTKQSDLNTTKQSDLNTTKQSDLNTTKQEAEDKRSIHTLSSTSLQAERPVKRIIIIRQFMTSSPSTISTVSSNLSFNVIDKDFDSVSTTSTIKANEVDEKSAIITESF